MSSNKPLSLGADFEKLSGKFRPIFAKIAEKAVEREKKRSLPYDEVRLLKEAGLGAVRIPKEYGGEGATIEQLIQLLIELSEADSNVAQAFRGHTAFVEDRINATLHSNQDKWFKRFLNGEIVGNAWTEIGDVQLNSPQTKVHNKDGKWYINGKKYYSTGSIFAEWIDVYSVREEDNSSVVAAVKTNQKGVSQSDDWDGFGQRTTGSGTSVFENAEVEEIIEFSSRFKYQTALYQLVIISVFVGTGRAILRDVSAEVAKRKRVYSHGNGKAVRYDPQIQQVVGHIAAQVYAAEATALSAARAAQKAYESHFAQDEKLENEANIAAEIESAKAQVAIANIVIQSASELFNALGTSATAFDLQLDRYWRNARTAASHNPLVYKERIIGDWEINRTEPPYIWKVGNL